MTTPTGFAPEKGIHFTFEKFAEKAPMLTAAEIVKNFEFFENAVRKGTYRICESLYKENEIRSMGYVYRPDAWFAILVYKYSEYVTRYLPGQRKDYTAKQIDKWVQEFDGESMWCMKPRFRYVPSVEQME